MLEVSVNEKEMRTKPPHRHQCTERVHVKEVALTPGQTAKTIQSTHGDVYALKCKGLKTISGGLMEGR